MSFIKLWGRGSLGCCSHGSQRVKHNAATEQQQNENIGKTLLFFMFTGGQIHLIFKKIYSACYHLNAKRTSHMGLTDGLSLSSRAQWTAPHESCPGRVAPVPTTITEKKLEEKKEQERGGPRDEAREGSAEQSSWRRRRRLGGGT